MVYFIDRWTIESWANIQALLWLWRFKTPWTTQPFKRHLPRMSWVSLRDIPLLLANVVSFLSYSPCLKHLWEDPPNNTCTITLFVDSRKEYSQVPVYLTVISNTHINHTVLSSTPEKLHSIFKWHYTQTSKLECWGPPRQTVIP